jgi:signal transduction histidine kinase/ActR/RegA family two-component response regulator
MSSAPQLEYLLSYRLDAVCLAVMAAAACFGMRWFLRRRQAALEPTRAVFVGLAALTILGTVVAEWIGQSLNFPVEIRLASLAMARAYVLGSTAVVIGVVLAATGLLAVMRAELKRHSVNESALHHAKTDADTANRAKGDFLAVMSHEMRTPLNAVMGFANLLSDTKLDEAQRGYVGTITGEGSRLAALINDILDLAKIDEGRLILERVPFSPVETIHEVLRLLGARAAEKKIDLRFEAQITGPLLLTGDPLRFRQIVLNLVDNALKFTATGSVTVFLAWSPAAHGAPEGCLTIRVRDTGIGISRERQAMLFRMFVQAEPSTTRRFGGTGLGLAICQRLVTLMGGDIGVKSEPGSGAEFSVKLPLAEIALPSSSDSAGPTLLSSGGHQPRILVVDDVETNRVLLEAFLRRHGFDAEIAEDGEAAVRLALAQRYDAILMDLQMPGLDGYAATGRIRAAESAGRHTPIIALTASIARGTREKCLAAGMDEFLTKPLDLGELRSLLRPILTPAAPAVAAPFAVGKNWARR